MVALHGMVAGKGSDLMKAAIIAAIVALLMSAASATAAFVVTSRNIKNGTIQMVDISAAAKRALKGNRGPRGPAGAQGLQGPAGAQGPQGPTGFIGPTTVVSQEFVAPAGSVAIHSVTCPAGTGVISGGVSSITAGDTWYDAPSGNGWAGAGNNFDGASSGTVRVYAICAQGAPVPSATSASELTRPAVAAAEKEDQAN